MRQGLSFTPSTNWAESARGYYGQSAHSYASMDKKKFATPLAEPRKTVGGALGAGLGMGMAGAAAAQEGWLGSAMQGLGTTAAGETVGSMAGPAGGAAGFAMGVLGYFL